MMERKAKKERKKSSTTTINFPRQNQRPEEDNNINSDISGGAELTQ